VSGGEELVARPVKPFGRGRPNDLGEMKACLQTKWAKTLTALSGVAYTDSQRIFRSSVVPKCFQSRVTEAFEVHAFARRRACSKGIPGAVTFREPL